jgi:circadian clock protein KaiB
MTPVYPPGVHGAKVLAKSVSTFVQVQADAGFSAQESGSEPLPLTALKGNETGTVLLRLYVAGGDARSAEARRLCEQVVQRCEPGPCQLEVVDVLTNPQQAELDRVLATPTLVRLDPPPVVRLIGGLWNADFVMEALQLNSTNEQRP